MINYTTIYILLSLIYFLLLAIGIFLIKRYTANNADFRTVNFVQFLMLATFLSIEAFHYLSTGEANQMCILLTRNFFLFASAAYLNCKLLGYRNVYTKRGLRNTLYVINNTLVYITIAFICVSYLKVEVYETEPRSIERIIQVLSFMGTDNYSPRYMSFIPVGYCAFASVLSVIMDKLEKRATATKIASFTMFVPLLVLILDSTPFYNQTHFYIRLTLNSLYFSIPVLVMVYEAFSIIYFSKKSEKDDDNIEKIIYKSFKENRREITKAGKIQAKVIAKEIEKDEEVLWLLPKGKKNEKYRDFIINLLRD